MQPIEIIDVDHLRSVLGESCVPLSHWVNPAKSVHDLCEEVRAGECIIAFENGRALRVVDAVSLDVFWDGRQLLELRQVLPDGCVRERPRATSLSEKMLPGETPEHCLYRMLREEYPALAGVGAVLERVPSRSERKQSPSYPGLRCLYRYPWYQLRVKNGADLPLEIAESGGKGKTVYYGWMNPVSPLLV